MKSHQALLKRLVQALVDEWGYEEVTTALAGTTQSAVDASAPYRPKGLPARRNGRPSATAQVERAALEGEQRDALLELAASYDSKQFLPSVAHVREFLLMMGDRPSSGMKDRSIAFRSLLQRLIQLPADRLRQIATSALHSGPAELGPLSDAIATVGERLPRRG